MNLEKLFQKAEIFFGLEESQRLEKKEKLKNSFEKKIKKLKDKIQNTQDNDKKIELKKHLSILKEFLSKLKDDL